VFSCLKSLTGNNRKQKHMSNHKENSLEEFETRSKDWLSSQP
jgi:hypothetical protein